MDLISFHNCLMTDAARGYPLNDEQLAAVNYGEGPLWLLAGPGSGKTEVLVTRTLKLICVDGIPPESIMVTTFTKKAALNLEDRLATYMVLLQKADQSLREIDLADLRVGTIHSLCNDIMHDYRYPDYQNVRLLESVEQSLFTYRHAEIAQHDDNSFWAEFEYAIPMWSRNSGWTPSRWSRTNAAMILFNHIVEDRVNLHVMRAAGGHWATLADFYQQYEQALRDNYRCDFAHLQQRFLEFIQSDASQRFIEGDGERNQPLRYILVDEYQDTNPIQESIYLALARNKPHNITVVGDDDQALYRFRGGSVACMVNFDQAMQAEFSVTPHVIQLDKNYRSHEQIVDFFNAYIASSPEMRVAGVRAPNKQPINAASTITGNYPAVNWLQTNRAGDLCIVLADFVEYLRDNVIEDLSQCVILMRSTKDSPRNAGPFMEEFNRRGIPFYNPRSKSFMESEEVQTLLASLIQVIDPNSTFLNIRTRDLAATVQSWIQTLIDLQNNNNYDLASLTEYITLSTNSLIDRCRENPNRFLQLNIMEILYRLLSLEPFPTWQQNPERNMRLSKVTRLFESYHSLNLDTLRVNQDGTDLNELFRERFYYTFISYLMNAGIDDDEDEDVIVPEGYLPLMTIHQSKGLEFPFVILVNIGSNPRVGPAQIIERDFTPFRDEIYARTTRPPETLAREDDIRLYYVAYSRAQYGLMIVATPSQITNNIAIPDATHFRRTTNRPTLI